MRRAWLVCPGPGMRATWARMNPVPTNDPIIAVNFAACSIAADYIVALDEGVWTQPIRPILTGRLLGICTAARRYPHPAPGRRDTIQDIWPYDLHPLVERIGLSFPAAVALAVCRLGVAQLDCIGVAWDGHGYDHADQAPEPGNAPPRWRQERAALLAIAGPAGCRVLRHHPTGEPTVEHDAPITPPEPAPRRRGRPPATVVESRPAPRPAEIDPQEARYRCQNCGRPTLVIAGAHYKDGAVPMRCTFCASRFTLRNRMLQAIRIRI